MEYMSRVHAAHMHMHICCKCMLPVRTAAGNIHYGIAYGIPYAMPCILRDDTAPSI